MIIYFVVAVVAVVFAAMVALVALQAHRDQENINLAARYHALLHNGVHCVRRRPQGLDAWVEDVARALGCPDGSCPAPGDIRYLPVDFEPGPPCPECGSTDVLVARRIRTACCLACGRMEHRWTGGWTINARPGILSEALADTAEIPADLSTVYEG